MAGQARFGVVQRPYQVWVKVHVAPGRGRSGVRAPLQRVGGLHGHGRRALEADRLGAADEVLAHDGAGGLAGDWPVIEPCPQARANPTRKYGHAPGEAKRMDSHCGAP